MSWIDILLLLGWLAFWAYWLIEAVRSGSRTVSSRGSMLIRIALFLVVLLLVRSGIFRGHTGAVSSPALQGIGLAAFVVGLGLALWARQYLGQNWGMPMSRKANGELVTSGPYRYVRHPIYSGIILAGAGTAVAVNFYALIIVVVVGSYFIYSATVEERTMSDGFPAAYPIYKQSTKMLIPFVF